MNAFDQGRIAYENGKALSNNPFDWSDRLQSDHYHTLWNDGWLHACHTDTPAGRLYKTLASSGVSMATCRAAEERL
jgi:hypothetical protein